jgi:hypothetical protein
LTVIQAKRNEHYDCSTSLDNTQQQNQADLSRGLVTVIASIMFSISLFLGATTSYASEIGVEVEAETFVSGETIEVIMTWNIFIRMEKLRCRSYNFLTFSCFFVLTMFTLSGNL